MKTYKIVTYLALTWHVEAEDSDEACRTAAELTAGVEDAVYVTAPDALEDVGRYDRPINYGEVKES